MKKLDSVISGSILMDQSKEWGEATMILSISLTRNGMKEKRGEEKKKESD